MIDKVMEILICGPIKTGLLDFEAMKRALYAVWLSEYTNKI